MEDKFKNAQERVVSLKNRPSNDSLLDLYGLFKQASVGDVQGKRPGLLDIKGRAKFDAWSSRQGMGREEAMQAYVDLVEKLVKAEG